MSDTLSKKGEAYIQEIESALKTKAFHRYFNSRFIDCQDFYKLSKQDQEKIRKSMNGLADELAYFSGEFVERFKIRYKKPLFTEAEMDKAPRGHMW